MKDQKLSKDCMQALKRLAGTPDGLTVLAYLKSYYLETSSLAENTHLTYYKLGQTDLIKDLINFSNQEKIDEVLEKYSQYSDDNAY